MRAFLRRKKTRRHLTRRHCDHSTLNKNTATPQYHPSCALLTPCLRLLSIARLSCSHSFIHSFVRSFVRSLVHSHRARRAAQTNKRAVSTCHTRVSASQTSVVACVCEEGFASFPRRSVLPTRPTALRSMSVPSSNTVSQDTVCVVGRARRRELVRVRLWHCRGRFLHVFPRVCPWVRHPLLPFLRR